MRNQARIRLRGRGRSDGSAVWDSSGHGVTLSKVSTDAIVLRGRRVGRGFTLIELLVVVSIIALLVSILLPALGGAREQTRTVMCANNLRQLALAAELYAGNNDGFWPPCTNASGNNAYYDVSDFLEYVAVDEVRHERALETVMTCPKLRALHYKTAGWTSEGVISDYAVNWGLGSRGLPAGKIRTPSEKVFMADCPGAHWFSARTNPPNWSNWDQKTMIIDPHGQRGSSDPVHYWLIGQLSNYVFFDGHVEPLRFDELRNDYFKLTP